MGSSATWHIGPDAETLDLSWSPYNVIMSSVLETGLSFNGQCGPYPTFCIPSLETNMALSSRGGAAIQGGLSVTPITLPAPTATAYPGTGSTTNTYAVNCKIQNEEIIGTIPPGPADATNTGLTTAVSVTNSVPRTQLGTLYSGVVSHALNHYYNGIPLEGANTQTYTTAVLLGGTGYNIGDTVTPYGQGSGGVLTVATVTGVGGAVLTMNVTTPGSGYYPKYNNSMTTLTGGGSGLYADIMPYYDTIYFPHFSTGNGNSGYANVRTDGCYWDIAVNGTTQSLITQYQASGYGQSPELLNASAGVFYDFGQALTAYTAPARNSTGDSFLSGTSGITTIGNFSFQNETLSLFGVGLAMTPRLATANANVAIGPTGTATQSVLSLCFNSDLLYNHCVAMNANTGGLYIGSDGAAVPIYTVEGSGSASNTLDNGSGDMFAKVSFGVGTLQAATNIPFCNNSSIFAGYNTLASCAGLTPTQTTVGALGSAATNSGVMKSVTDSTVVAAEGQTCVGGSGTPALAFSNGTIWKCF